MPTDKPLDRAALAYDCDDGERGPCAGKPGLDPAVWCAPCVARALLAEVERLRGIVEAVARCESPTNDDVGCCVLCSGVDGGASPRIVAHDTDCPWLLARAYLADTGPRPPSVEFAGAIEEARSKIPR